MNEHFEQVLIDVFSTTCNLSSSKMTFEQYFLTHSNTIFNYFHFENPTQDEINLIIDIFVNPTENYLGLKNIVYNMSLNPSLTSKDIEDYTFQSICPIICSAINKHRLLKDLKDQKGIVIVDVENIIATTDLFGGQADYYIVKQQKGWNVYSKTLQFLKWFETDQEATDYCHSCQSKIFWLKVVGTVIGGGIVGTLAFKYFIDNN